MVNTSATITHPYICFQEIIGIPEAVLDGYAGLTNKRMQIDCFAKSYGGAKGLAAAVSAALAASTIPNVKIGQMDGEYNEVVKDYHVITEFSIWSED